jgi:hypothetical protein
LREREREQNRERREGGREREREREVLRDPESLMDRKRHFTKW